MKKIRKFLSLIVISVLALTVITTSPVKADASNPLKGCSDCDFTTPKVIFNAIGGCSAVYYVTGVDACRVALSYLGTSKKNNVQYELKGTYIPGKIPGSEPSYSGPCNTGYWEYRVARS